MLCTVHLSGNLEVRGHLGDQDENGMIILKWILKRDMILRIGTGVQGRASVEKVTQNAEAELSLQKMHNTARERKTNVNGQQLLTHNPKILWRLDAIKPYRAGSRVRRMNGE
jgi:hypothetical protein